MTPEQTVRLDRVKRALPPEMGAIDFVVEEDGKITRWSAGRRVREAVVWVHFRTTNPEANWSFAIGSRGAIQPERKGSHRHVSAAPVGEMVRAREMVSKALAQA